MDDHTRTLWEILSFYPLNPSVFAIKGFCVLGWPNQRLTPDLHEWPLSQNILSLRPPVQGHGLRPRNEPPAGPGVALGSSREKVTVQWRNSGIQQFSRYEEGGSGAGRGGAVGTRWTLFGQGAIWDRLGEAAQMFSGQRLDGSLTPGA